MLITLMTHAHLKIMPTTLYLRQPLTTQFCMFSLAAATTRLYEKKIIINLQSGETKKPLPMPDDLGSDQSCASILDPNKTPFNTSVVQNYLKLPKSMSGNAFADFISPDDYKLYVNQNVTQDQYLTAVLGKINIAGLNSNANVVGVTLYNVKPSYKTQPTLPVSLML